jgi:hypothetical protein
MMNFLLVYGWRKERKKEKERRRRRTAAAAAAAAAITTTNVQVLKFLTALKRNWCAGHHSVKDYQYAMDESFYHCID